MSRRYLVVSGAETALRMVAPPRGSLRVGASLDCDVRSTEPGVEPLHAELFVGPELGARARGPDVAVLDPMGEHERPVEAGALVELEAGERLRVGPLELALAEGLPAEAGPRTWDPGAVEGMEPGLAAGAPFPSVDPTMTRLERLLEQAAASDEPVLVLGETGTGKDLLVAEVHRRSPRGRGTLVRLSAVEVGEAGLPADAVARAAGGTLLLDEVSALSPRAQLGLTQAIEQATADGARIVATSNQDLEGSVRAGTFRKDLFFRLARFRIDVPPLRARPADVRAFTAAFLERAGVEGAPSLAVLDALERYPWPGNVRELEGVIARAVLASGGGPLQLEHLPPELGEPGPVSPAPEAEARDGPEQPSMSLRDEMNALERRRILEALERHPTQTEAAKALGIPLRTFLNRMDALGIPRARKK